MSSVGLSVGNTVMLRYISIIIITIILFFYNRFHHYHTYTNKEREKVLHFLAFNLLLSRDGYYQNQNEMNVDFQEQENKEEEHQQQLTEESIVKKLQVELSNQTEVKRFLGLESIENNNSKEFENGDCNEVIGLELGKTPNFDENKQNLNQSISTSSNSPSQRSSSTSSTRSSSFSKNLRNQINPLNSQHPSKEIILNPLSSSPNISNSPRNSNQNNNS